MPSQLPKMNVALVILHADPARGGAERYTIDLAAALVTRGHTVSLLASRFAAVPADVRAIELPANGWSRTGRYFAFLNGLDGHLKDHKYDVVHAALPVRHCDVYHPHAGLAVDAIQTGHRKRTGWASVLSWVNNRVNPRRNAFARVERQLLTGRNPPLVVSLSDYVKAGVIRHFTLPQDRHATLFNAVNLTRFDPVKHEGAGTELRTKLGVHSDDVLALIIAQDFERKGLREAILALVNIPDERLKLVVVGKPDTAPWIRLAAHNRVGHRVMFAGSTTRPEDFYAACQFFVLPTRHDPCSLVVLEALAMGLPVLSTVYNGACDIITAGKHGFVLTDPTDVPTLTAAIQQLLDPGRRDLMREACLALRPRLAYDAHVDQVEAIYARCAAGRDLGESD